MVEQEDRFPGQLVQTGRPNPVIAVAADVVGTGGVEGDENHVADTTVRERPDAGAGREGEQGGEADEQDDR